MQGEETVQLKQKTAAVFPPWVLTRDPGVGFSEWPPGPVRRLAGIRTERVAVALLLSPLRDSFGLTPNSPAVSRRY